MIQKRLNKLYKQAKYDWKRELFIYFCEIKAMLKDGTKMSQKGAYLRRCPKEVPLQFGALLLLLAPLALISFQSACI